MRNIKKNISPEQYELQEKLPYHFTMNRRSFLQAMGGGLAVAFTFGDTLGKSLSLDDNQIASWLHVGEDGLVTIYTGKAEVGQNIRTSLAQLVAEELPVSVDKIEMVMGDTALTPYDRGTFGSRSIPFMGPELRKAAASAREALFDLAASKWKVEKGKLSMQDGVIKNSVTNATIEIGKLTEGKKLLRAVDSNIRLKSPEEWKVAGTWVRKVRGESFLTGKHKYVSDMKLPGMMYGKILRAPSYGAVLMSADVSAARKMPNIVVVQDKDFVGVAAPDSHTATVALKAIKAEWKITPQPSRNEIFHYITKNSDNAGKDEDSAGDITRSFEQSQIKVEKTFNVDYIAHVPLEPRAGVAQWAGGKLTVWTGTQRPFGVQEDLAEVFMMSKEDIRVIQPDTGSGYGGKHTGEAGVEAARLARAAGKPVKVVWTREEEFAWAYFRPAGVIEVRAGASKEGKLTAWEFHNHNSGSSGIETPYEVENKRVRFHQMDSPLRQGSYRGLAATANTYARECIMDDLAAELKMDPLKFRLQNLKEQRMINVLNAAASAFGWDSKKPDANHGFGIACGTEKGSFIATCAEISVDDSSAPKVIKAVVAFECGPIINPEHLKNQIEGAVIQGLGGALFEHIDFKEGKLLNGSMSQYRVPRFNDTPQLEIVMLNRKDIPSAGAGETPILAIAPAIRNAHAQATGKRIFTLPLFPGEEE